MKTSYARAFVAPQTGGDWVYTRQNAKKSVILLAAYGATGRSEEARELVALFRKALPNFQPGPYLSRAYPFKNQSDIDRLLADLAKAGLE